MTWVLGSGLIYGYGALIADTRVTWPTGEFADILCKIHPVAPNMIAGFAGSVEFGFHLVDDLKRFLDVGEDHRVFPRYAALRWWRRARRMYASASDEVRAVSSSLLLAGASPALNGPWHRAYCIRFRAPDFQPEFLQPNIWHSIGSGEDHLAAQQFARQSQHDFFSSYGQGELSGAGGVAAMTAGSVQESLRRTPMTTVGDAVVHGVAFLNKSTFGTVTSYHRDELLGWRRVGIGRLATTWAAFVRMTREHRIEASASVATAR